MTDWVSKRRACELLGMTDGAIRSKISRKWQRGVHYAVIDGGTWVNIREVQQFIAEEALLERDDEVARLVRNPIVPDSNPFEEWSETAADLHFPNNSRLLMSETMNVYLMGIPAARSLKIGIAKDPYNRHSTIQTASPSAVLLLSCFMGGEEEESMLHSKFARYWIRGEWFKWHKEIIEEFDRRAAADHEHWDATAADELAKMSRAK